MDNDLTFMGHAWSDSRSYSAHATVNRDGKVVGRREYNIMDGTGGHDIYRPHKAARPYLPQLKELVGKAIGDALAKKDYRAARRRDTKFPDLAFAFLVTSGRGGHSIYIDSDPDSSSTLSGYGLEGKDQDHLAEIDRLGIPYIDSRTVPDDKIVGATFNFPMYPNKPGKADPAPWGGMSFAPIPVIAWMYHSIGAIVRNVEMVKPEPGQLRSLKDYERIGLIGYTSGNEGMVGAAMMMARQES